VPARRGVITSSALLAWLMPAEGCAPAVVGSWRLVRASPDREVFALDEVEFAGDGSYAATITLDGRTVRESGTFRFDGFRLTLRPADGGERQYAALVRSGELEVRNGRSIVRLRRDGP
jgi:hypothetical protein